MLELLESRQLMSASFNSLTGVVSVIGTSNADQITITRSNTMLYVNENDTSIHAFVLAKVKKIYANGKLGTDTIKVDPAVTIPAELHGGGCVEVSTMDDDFGWKCDHLIGGSGDDMLFDDGSPSMLEGRNGNDFIKFTGGTYADGDGGNDYLLKVAGSMEQSRAFGSSGIDTFSVEGYSVGQYVGNTADLKKFNVQPRLPHYNGDCWYLVDFENFRGGSGDDIIYGSADSNTLHGGAGNDRLYGLDGTDTIFGDAGNDRIDGGKGFDKLYGGDNNDYLIANDGYTHDLVDGGYGYDQAKIDIFDTGSTGIEKYLT